MGGYHWGGGGGGGRHRDRDGDIERDRLRFGPHIGAKTYLRVTI